MRKYGIEHFFVHLIEETNDPDTRECYWIQYYNSYTNGYNATLGGDGRSYIDYNLIISLWKQGLTCKEISIQTKHDAGQIGKILQANGISAKEIQQQSLQAKKKPVIQLNKITNESIATFNSCQEAARAMIQLGYSNCKPNTGAAHISEVCRNKRKTFAGFAWQYID